MRKGRAHAKVSRLGIARFSKLSHTKQDLRAGSSLKTPDGACGKGRLRFGAHAKADFIGIR